MPRALALEDRPRRSRPRRPAGPRLRRRLLPVARAGVGARRRAARRARRRGLGGGDSRRVNDDCLFCQLYREGDHVHSADGFVAIRDINPQAPVHLLVLPERHIDSFREIGEFPPEEAKRMLEFVADVAAREGLTDYRVAVNVGPSAGQTVFHLHWHIKGGWA
ncbi:MAG: HIT domain-containing protein [Gaiellaceae bacterium]